MVTFWTTFGCHFGADGPGVIFTAGLGVIFTAGLGVIVTSWRLGLIKPHKAFQGLLIYSMYYIYIYMYYFIRLIRLKSLIRA